VFDFDELRPPPGASQRAASGTWRQRTPGEVAGFIRAAARMRESDTGLFQLDTSALDAEAVASRLEAWMAHTSRDGGI
jgi:hypothetical protein